MWPGFDFQIWNHMWVEFSSLLREVILRVHWLSPLLKNHPMILKRVVSKETVVLRRWGSSMQKFGFINGVDNVNWPPYRESKS